MATRTHDVALEQQTTEYEVCFIVENVDTKEGATEYLKLAFDAMSCQDLEPSWVAISDCLKVKKRESRLFVLDPFSGPVFDHLLSVNCRLVGPLCIISCLKHGETLPRRLHPVYSTAMRKITVTCSNVDKPTRDDIARKVELMGGFFSRDLTKSVSHLVVGDVGSKKYHVAASFGLPIMQPDWIEEVWNTGQFKQIRADDPLYDCLRCPVFKGLSISVSQLSIEERETVKILVEKHGGQYSGPLKLNHTTHLILNEPKGDKYKYAKSWKLHCVRVEWLHKSIEARYCMDENLYQLDTKSDEHKSSTPKKDVPYSLPPDAEFSKISYIGVSHLDETTKAETSFQLDDSIRPLVKKSVCSLDVLETFDTSSVPKDGQYFDGCKFFLSGFKDFHLEKLCKIINAGGGMRFNKYSESISHVVCGAKNVQLIRNIKASSSRPHVVNFQWLLECCKKQKLLDESDFSCMKNMPLSPEKVEINPLPSMIDQSSSVSQKTETFLDDFEDIMKQYMPSNTDFSCPINLTKEQDVSVHKDSFNCKETDHRTEDKAVNIGTEVSVNNLNISSDSHEEDDNNHLFRGICFLLVGFGPKDKELLTEMIESKAGITSDQNSDLAADVAVVPILWNDLSLKAKEIATDCWLQMCIEEGSILKFEKNPLFRPLHVDQSRRPLGDCVLSISQYIGTERDCLKLLAEVAGAVCQEYFVRKANKPRSLLPNTHLVVASPEGSKFEAAKKWLIPAVTKYWLIDAATSGQLPAIEKYLVDEVMDSKNSDNSDTSIRLIKEPLEIEPVKKLTSIEQTDEYQINMKKLPAIKPSIEEIKNDPPQYEKRSCTSNAACSNRIKEIIDDARVLNNKYSMKDISSSSFLNPENEYEPNFDVEEMLQHFDSPAIDVNSGSLKKQSLPLEEVFSHNLSAALEKFSDEDRTTKPTSSVVDLHFEEHDSQPLNGVTLCVAKKLSDVQGELNRIISSLGGDYRWSYDHSCTHFVFRGKANDFNREYRLARDQGKKIVSPEWVHACKEVQNIADESLYPHTLKSKFKLSEQLSTSKRSFTENDQNLQETVERDNDDEARSKIDIEKNEQVDKPESLDVNKQLEELIVAVKTAKADKRKPHRRSDSKPCSPVEVGNNVSKTISFERPALAVYSNGNRKGSIHAIEAATSEPSQCLPITWDDPTGRKEREKIAEQLAIVGKGVRTSQSQEDAHITVMKNDHELVHVEHLRVAPERNFKNQENVKKFMFTGLSDYDKTAYSAVVRQVGGLVSEEKCFDKTATHLILGRPIKNEKLLSSVASGKWVLHQSYIDALRTKNTFVDEEPYEWGGFATNSFIQNFSENVTKVAFCPRRWRLNLTSHKKKTGAFQGWKVFIIAEQHKGGTYSKILRAGGAEIIPLSPVTNLSEATHAFVEEMNADITQLISSGVMCLKPEYLAYYLIDDPPPAEKDYLVPQALELFNRMPSSRSILKRRQDNIVDPTEVKKSRFQ